MELSTTSSSSSILLPEILGFSPQLLLDDIISEANQSIYFCTDALEKILDEWMKQRREAGPSWDGTKEVEEGLQSLQMLLESHTDVAFDFFETWSLRNVFYVRPELSMVAPHHRGLDLTVNGEEELELMAEIEEYRQKIDNQKRLKVMLNRAVRLSKIGRKRSERRVRRLDYLNNPEAQQLFSLYQDTINLFESVSSLPHKDIGGTSAPPRPDHSKRQWEIGKAGYIEWATSQLVGRSKAKDVPKKGSTIIGSMVENAASIGGSIDLRTASEVENDSEEVVPDAPASDSMDTS